MAIDSTAELLFQITANTDDAEGNIKRFRKLIGTDLDEMSSQFKDWSDKLLGEITTVQGAMTAGFAVMAAGLLAVGAAVREATKDYEAYAGEISRAMKLTGLSAETLSAMHSAAVKTGTDFETLTNGLVKFEQSIVKGSEGSKVQLAAFTALGISQKEVIAGQANMLPLLEKVMDGFHGNASAVQKAALAKDLFTRSGTQMLSFLSKGSEYLKENADEAARLGLILTNQDIVAAREFTLAQREMKEECEALAVTIGKHVVPILEKLEAAAIASIAAIKQGMKGGLEQFKAPFVFLGEYGKTLADIHKAVQAAGDQEPPDPLLGKNPKEKLEKIKEAQTDFFGISSIIEGMRAKIAANGDEFAKLAEEISHYQFEIGKATEELHKLQAAGTITAASSLRETTVLTQAQAMLGQIVKTTGDKIIAARMEVIIQGRENEEAAHTQLIDRLAAYQSESYDHQRAALQREVDSLRESLEKKAALTQEDYDLLEQIHKAGLEKIQRAEDSAFLKQMAQLQQTLDAQFAATLTGQRRLEAEYDRDLEKYNEQEREKTATLARGSVERNAIESLYETLRAQLLLKYQTDLNALQNSQGWQGVFGSIFAQTIRRNEQLFREWSTSATQSILVVRATMESLKEMGQDAFRSFAQGMGQNISQALVYKKSIGEAMEAALASTLESLGGQAIAAAIMATGWGLYDLAMGDYVAAGQMFASAAIFGGFGAATALAGMAIAPSQDSSSASGAAAGGSGASSTSGVAAGSGSSDSGQRRPTVNVYVQGHVIGVGGAQALIDIINQGVYNNDMTLYASHNAQGAVLG